MPIYTVHQARTRLSRLLARVGAGEEVAVSAASAMEVATKHRLGRLPEASILAQDFEAIVLAEGFPSLSISLRHAATAGGLRIAH